MNKLKISIYISLLIFSSSAADLIGRDSVFAWVFFNSKDTSCFNPVEYFEPGAIERRIKMGLNPCDYLDIPVSPHLIDSLSFYCIEVAGASNWLNAALVKSEDMQLEIIGQLGFVDFVEKYHSGETHIAGISSSGHENPVPGDWIRQVELHGISIFEQNELDGRGITIAVFDGGFPGVDTHTAFRHLHEEDRIKATWDFASNSADVYRYNNHGTAVLSCICGIKDGNPAGMATGSSFLLARTELRGEPWKEELYWIQAAEWADRMGAGIISSSLGYTYHRYFQSDMDGKKTPVARAANIAAGKGILVINCMGNEGDNDWKYAVSPADADSVLSVGGVDPDTGLHIEFSSLGPNMSGVSKPNVVASGKALAASPDGWKTVYGTSFSAPLVTGFAACAWQLYPELDNMEIFSLLECSGNLYPYYDYAHGYGIPEASRLLAYHRDEDMKNIEGIKTGSEPGSLVVYTDYLQAYKGEADNYLYYNFRDSENEIVSYGVYLLQGTAPLRIHYSESDDIKYCYLRTKDNYQQVKLR